MVEEFAPHQMDCSLRIISTVTDVWINARGGLLFDDTRWLTEEVQLIRG